MNPLYVIKAIYSVGLLIFSTAMIMALIFNEDTKVARQVHPAVAFLSLWGALIWLTMVEGGQASLVGLAPINRELYKDSHPITNKNTMIVHVGDNLDRYLLGRQFMVVLVVFTINNSGGPLAGATLWGLPDIVLKIFLSSGMAMILLTANVGQLTAQVNSSLHMLDYINTYFSLFTVWVAMGIEFSGLLHSAYVCQIIVTKLAGQQMTSNEEPRNGAQNFFFWARCIMSVGILVMCFIVTITALFEGKTTVWEGLPAPAALVIFFLLLSVVGLLEGMQIAFFYCAKLPVSERGTSFFAKKTGDLLYGRQGLNLPGFMVGRQLCVVSCMFFVARVTSLEIKEGEENIFGVSDGLQKLFNTGLLGAFITTIIGSVAWQLLASAFPVFFMSLPFTYIFLIICLGLDATGLCQGAWVLAAIQKKIMGFQRDEVYIGSAEERAAKNMSDDADGGLPSGAGHMIKLPGFYDQCPPSLKKLMKKDPSVVQYLQELESGLAAKQNAENN
jgi:Silicon transporter